MCPFVMSRTAAAYAESLLHIAAGAPYNSESKLVQ
jgi:hypothetical protein